MDCALWGLYPMKCAVEHALRGMCSVKCAIQSVEWPLCLGHALGLEQVDSGKMRLYPAMSRNLPLNFTSQHRSQDRETNLTGGLTTERCFDTAIVILTWIRLASR